MADFKALETELNGYGVKIYYHTEHDNQVLAYIYDDIFETKETMDNIVQSYLTNFTITSTLVLNRYKGDAVIENANF
jgi:hypothetical protein